MTLLIITLWFITGLVKKCGGGGGHILPPDAPDLKNHFCELLTIENIYNYLLNEYMNNNYKFGFKYLIMTRME